MADAEAKNDLEFMAQAIELGRKGIYSTRPNPAVGCVIVKDGRVIASGWHRKAGQPHAEIEALKNASESVEGATVYVTLEPCSHMGKTPPCADALVVAKVARVVVAMQDPNPLVAGQGIERLRQAGIKVDVGLLESDARQLNQGFIRAMSQGLPYVRLKVAASLDGRTAMKNGESQWITGEEARSQVQLMRARHGAIVTGIGTVLADDPSLTVRLPKDQLQSLGLTEETCQPIRVVLDAHLSMPLEAKMLSLDGRTILMTSKESAQENPDLVEKLYQAGAEVVAVAAEEERLDIESVLRYLHEEEQIRDVMVEAGSIVAGAFVQSGLVNEIHAFFAPILMGDQAKPMFSLLNMHHMADKVSLDFQSVTMVGQDVYAILKPSGLPQG
ncbi:MAG: bifunctional diaminohydroxyphosphoribosylaminopyrimidine deaminase/5-amino-6-(5-phosphoribosylamino)uracil reductase RibD [Hydrogenovibrio sp.]|nr:bifunctional diaminohydroxyphosphoribosylaminopyrimidine deaminase/5-amino-6-(5-phosphoribosylamino)uracil reductase RibD [Hydrogenovibrio sp.]